MFYNKLNIFKDFLNWTKIVNFGRLLVIKYDLENRLIPNDRLCLDIRAQRL